MISQQKKCLYYLPEGQKTFLSKSPTEEYELYHKNERTKYVHHDHETGNFYLKGDKQSLIQVNKDDLVYVKRHFTYFNTEQDLVKISESEPEFPKNNEVLFRASDALYSLMSHNNFIERSGGQLDNQTMMDTVKRKLEENHTITNVLQMVVADINKLIEKGTSI